MRIATSKPSSIRSTKRSSAMISSESSGCSLAKSISDWPISASTKVRGTEMRSRPLSCRIALAHQIGEIVDLLQDFGGGAVIGVAGLGQRKLPGRAIEQQRAELVLQFAHIFGQQRLGAPDRAGGGGKSFGIDDIDEGAYAGQVSMAPLDAVSKKLLNKTSACASVLNTRKKIVSRPEMGKKIRLDYDRRIFLSPHFSPKSHVPMGVRRPSNW